MRLDVTVRRHNLSGQPLSFLENLEVSAITFVRNYVQLHFDGPYLNAYVWPDIHKGDTLIQSTTACYRDCLCKRIGKTVLAATEIAGDRLCLHFTDGVVLDISLKESDRTSGEAAMFQDGTGKFWRVW